MGLPEHKYGELRQQRLLSRAAYRLVRHAVTFQAHMVHAETPVDETTAVSLTHDVFQVRQDLRRLRMFSEVFGRDLHPYLMLAVERLGAEVLSGKSEISQDDYPIVIGLRDIIDRGCFEDQQRSNLSPPSSQGTITPLRRRSRE